MGEVTDQVTIATIVTSPKRHISVNPWICSAVPDSQQPNSSIGSYSKNLKASATLCGTIGRPLVTLVSRMIKCISSVRVSGSLFADEPEVKLMIRHDWSPMTSVRLGCVWYPRTRDVYIESKWVVFLYLPEVDRNEWKLFEIYKTCTKHMRNLRKCCGFIREWNPIH